MKTSSAILIVLGLASAISSAQVPGLMSYQGRVVDNTGTGLGTGTPINRKIIFRIFDAGTGGNRLWSEEQTVTLSNGDFSVILGQGSSASYNGSPETPRPSLLTVFGGTDRYLEIVVDNGDGAFNNTDTPIAPRQRLVSTAFAVRAATADSVASGTDLNLRDSNHGLGWYGSGRPFNGVNLDGPVLYGFGGGVLGSVNGAVQTIALRWTNTGNIGVGTATPSEKLDVVGNAKISGNLTVGGMGTFGGGVAAPANDSGGSGMRLTLFPGSSISTPYGLGIDSSTLFSVVPSSSFHKWYGGTTERMSLNGSNGNLTVGGSVNGASFTSSGNISTASLSSSGNISTASLSSTGNISAASLTSTGGLSFGGFGAEADKGGSSGDYISFDSTGFSEDYIGYVNNTFYMRDSPGGGDSTQPGLEVGGKITAKDKPVTTGEEELRIIRGVVLYTLNSGNPTLTVNRGSGFFVDRIGTGDYLVNINQSFSGNVTPTVTPYSDEDTYDFVRVGEAGTNQFRIKFKSSNGSPIDRSFSFIVVGPR